MEIDQDRQHFAALVTTFELLLAIIPKYKSNPTLIRAKKLVDVQHSCHPTGSLAKAKNTARNQ